MKTVRCKSIITINTLIVLLVCFLMGIVQVSVVGAQDAQLEQALFGSLQERFEQAKKNEVNFYAPQNYKRAFQEYEVARENFKSGEKLSGIREKIEKTNKLLDRAFETTRVSKVALEELVKTRSRFLELDLNYYAPDEVSRSERNFQKAILKAEEGDLRKAYSEMEETNKQYRLATIKWLKDGLLKQSKSDLKNLRHSLNRSVYQNSQNKLKNVEKLVNQSRKEEFDPFQFREEIIEKVRAALYPLYPSFYKNLPDTLLIGEFILIVETYSDKGSWDFKQEQANGLTGTAWTRFNCGLFLIPVTPQGYFKTINTFQVVSLVTDPVNQVSLNEARLIQPNIQVGNELKLELSVQQHGTKSIISAKQDLLKKAKQLSPKGEILVHFDDLTIKQLVGRPNVGLVTHGKAGYPAKQIVPDTVKLYVEGFTALIDTFSLNTTGATANINLEFPASIASTTSCKPASVHLGTLPIAANCEFYADSLSGPFAPWIIGETGMIASGTSGIIADFSSSQSPLSKPNSWKGVLLSTGSASGSVLVSDSSNTGYLTGAYSFTNATVTYSGFAGKLNLTAPVNFHPVCPVDYHITLSRGYLDAADSKIISGALGPGFVELPAKGVGMKNPGDVVIANFSSFTVQKDLDLAGQVSFTPGTTIAWGELTHLNEEIVAWNLDISAGYFYLPAGPTASFSPDIGTGFLNFTFVGSLTSILAQLESSGMAGITIDGKNMNNIAIYSPDGKSGTFVPITMKDVDGWLRIGSRGVDGELKIKDWDIKLDFGNVKRYGYIGGKAFKSILSEAQKEKPIMIKYASSAVYDSEINGSIAIPAPCNIPKLEFTDMELTSTANMVGGSIKLGNNVKLEHWDLAFVHTGKPTEQSGVVSARSGRLIFTAAGIWEDYHFSKPFALTWCEMFANGNIGEMFLDYNNYGQRFDNLPYVAHHIALSKYKSGSSGATNGAYLAVCGTVHFNFFGSNFINIKDAYSSTSPASQKHRYVTVPKNGEASCKATDLHLHGEWNNILRYGKLVLFDFPDAKMDYNVKLQQGFIGTGTGSISFIQSNALGAKIEIHRDAIDICLQSIGVHDVNFGLYARLGSIGEVWGCARIEGPQLKRINVGGYMEASAATGAGILAPKAGYITTVNMTVTPNSCIFYSSGDMELSVALSHVVVSGSVRLTVDYKKKATSGEIKGKIDCSNTVSGLEGEGQITWYVDPSIQHFQGRVKIEVCSWAGGGGLEGGIFIGYNVPKTKAWVLKTRNEHFGISDAILPDTLTGVFGYGQLSFSVQWYIFGGGIDLYAGLGAFTNLPTGKNINENYKSVSVLPYVLGSMGVNVHGEILGGLVSASAWGDLDMVVSPVAIVPLSFEGDFGLKGCVLWVICASVEVTAGVSAEDGFYIF